MAEQHDTTAPAPETRLRNTSQGHDLFLQTTTVASWHDDLLTNATLKIHHSSSQNAVLFQLHIRRTLKNTSAKTQLYILVQPQDMQVVKCDSNSQSGQRAALSSALDRFGPRHIRLDLTLSCPPVVITPLDQDLACTNVTKVGIRNSLCALSRQSDLVLYIAHNTVHQEQLDMLCADLRSRSIMPVAYDGYIAKLYRGKGGRVVFGPDSTTSASGNDDEAAVEAVVDAEPDADDGLVNSEILPSPPSYDRAVSLSSIPPVVLPEEIERPAKRQRRSSDDGSSELSGVRLVMASCRQMLEEQQQAFAKQLAAVQQAFAQQLAAQQQASAKQLAEQQQVNSNLQQSLSDLQHSFSEHQAQQSAQSRPVPQDQIRQIERRLYAKLAPRTRLVNHDDLDQLRRSVLDATADLLKDHSDCSGSLLRHQTSSHRRRLEEFVKVELDKMEASILEHLGSATVTLQYPTYRPPDI